MSETGLIPMGHGQMVDLIGRGAGQWELVFSEEGIASYKAPPVNEVEMELIDGNGHVHPLKIAESGNISSLLATGRVDGAYRARVRVWHGDHFHTREASLPGAKAARTQLGPNGGAIARLSADASIEIKRVDDETWQLIFAGKADAPAPDKIVVQAIDTLPDRYGIRNLVTEAGPTATTLLAKGKIKDAAYARLTVTTGAGTEIRSVPVAAVAAEAARAGV